MPQWQHANLKKEITTSITLHREKLDDTLLDDPNEGQKPTRPGGLAGAD